MVLCSERYCAGNAESRREIPLGHLHIVSTLDVVDFKVFALIEVSVVSPSHNSSLV